MTLQNRLSDITTRVATECKALRTLLNGNGADLSALTTANKANLVAALNELKAAVDAVSGGAGINDAATGAGSTWSSTKISTEIAAASAALLGSAPEALNALDELAAALGDDANFAATTSAALGNRVRVDTAAQGLTGPQQANARTNIGAIASADIGDPETNFVTIFNAGLI